MKVRVVHSPARIRENSSTFLVVELIFAQK